MIDEVSMLGSDLFTKLAAIGAAVRGCAKPFGGIQVRTQGRVQTCPPLGFGSDTGSKGSINQPLLAHLLC